MPDGSHRPPSDMDAVDELRVGGYLLDETLPGVTASRIAAELGAAMASRARRGRHARVAAILLVTAAAAAVIVALLPAKPRPEVAPASAVPEPPKIVASVPPPTPQPVPDWKRPAAIRQAPARETPVPAPPPAQQPSPRRSQPEETSPLTAQAPSAVSGVPAPSAPPIVTGAVVPPAPADDAERKMTMFAVRTDRPHGRPMYLKISYRPGPSGPAKETPQ
jgi:outer membrane biosynthesis protein TonB